MTLPQSDTQLPGCLVSMACVVRSLVPDVTSLLLYFMVSLRLWHFHHSLKKNRKPCMRALRKVCYFKSKTQYWHGIHGARPQLKIRAADISVYQSKYQKKCTKHWSCCRKLAKERRDMSCHNSTCPLHCSCNWRLQQSRQFVNEHLNYFQLYFGIIILGNPAWQNPSRKNIRVF